MILKQIKYCINYENGAQMNNIRRFYKKATYDMKQKISHPEHKFIIKLDNKPIKTPMLNQLALPTSQLAFLVTCELNRQHQYLKIAEMPLLGLCRTAVDTDFNSQLNYYFKNSVIEYLKTDSLLFFDDIYHLQYQQKVTPLIKNFSKIFQCQIEPSKSIYPPQIYNYNQFENWLNNLNNWQLIGFETMAIWMKSTISAYTILTNKFTREEIEDAAYFQQNHQMKYNGVIQQKLMEKNQMKLMVSCGDILYRFSKCKQLL